MPKCSSSCKVNILQLSNHIRHRTRHLHKLKFQMLFCYSMKDNFSAVLQQMYRFPVYKRPLCKRPPTILSKSFSLLQCILVFPCIRCPIFLKPKNLVKRGFLYTGKYFKILRFKLSTFFN